MLQKGLILSPQCAFIKKTKQKKNLKERKYAWFKFLNDIIRMKSYVGLKHQTLMMHFLR